MALRKLFLFSCLFVIYSYGECSTVVSAFGYHERVGIPLAEELLKTERISARIVGGSQVSVASAIPHQAGILVTLTTGWTSICGGSLVSNTRILTAAHCWNDGSVQARLFTIVLGSLTIFTGGTRQETTDVTVHPNWNAAAITHDIAIVRITSVAFTNNIQPVVLPAISDAHQDFSGLSAVASGYGKTSDAQSGFPTTTSLHHTTVSIITNVVCQRSFDVSIHGSHLCTAGTGGVGTCDGDSGGPLTVIWNNRRTLVGITSFGLGEGCQRGLPSVFTRVTAFLGWITPNL